jgi:4-alpha-glucanotransferase
MKHGIDPSLKAALAASPSAGQWQRIGLQKRAGVLAPLFSLYSKNSTGVGDFHDLRLLIDWAAATGNSIVQLLPMNELGGVLCPYDSVSSFALEPMYISLLPFAAEERGQCAGDMAALRKDFPSGGRHLDYGIRPAKQEALKKVFLSAQVSLSGDFEAYCRAQEYWLDDFALFKVLKEYYGGLPWYEWEPVYRDHIRTALEVFSRQWAQDLLFQKWLQYVAFTQFTEAKRYAGEKGVFLKGDLPILVSRDSADVWANPKYFKLDTAAGAPPDMYCAKGQRWGMPTYQWDRIAGDGYRYLKEKLAYAGNFYDILRVDHVVGLFRIWSIPFHEPFDNQGLHGTFDPAEESRWGGQGRELLAQMLGASGMLLCAEDLGVIPPVCTHTLAELGIPGNDVQRWVKDWNVRHDFLSPEEYRVLSVATLSTHDTTSWLGWWENEAGTVDEALFMRRCQGRVDFPKVRELLFDPGRSGYGRLRWRESVDSVDTLVRVLGRRHEEVGDFIEMYLNTFQEKEKFWKARKCRGAMCEKGDGSILAQALESVLESRAIFAIQLMTDWLCLSDELCDRDHYEYRINTPGTISNRNWSLVYPVSLDALRTHPVTKTVKSMIKASGRH